MAPKRLAGRWSVRNAAAAMSIGPMLEEEAVVSADGGDNREKFFKAPLI